MICVLSQLVLGKRNLASMVVEEKLFKLGMPIVTVIDLLSASCFKIVGLSGMGRFGAANRGTEVVNIFLVGPIAFVSVTSHPKVLPANETSISLVKISCSVVPIICSVNKVPAGSVTPHILLVETIFESEV